MTRLGRTFTIAALCVLASAATAHASSARGCCGQRRELEVGPKAPACANVLSRGWTVHGREFSVLTLATGDERGQVRAMKAHGEVPVLPRGRDVGPLRQRDGRVVAARGDHEGAGRRVAGVGIRARPARRGKRNLRHERTG